MTEAWLTIGEMARATHLSVKSLRHYDEIGLLPAAHVDDRTGYRRYTVQQLVTAEVIRRFRELGMPLAEIRVLLTSADVRTRADTVAGHLRRLEDELDRTRNAVSSLRDLLDPPAGGDGVEIRSVDEAKVAAVAAVVAADDAVVWAQGALGEIYATLAVQGLAPGGPAGAIFADELFTLHRGAITVFVPCDGPVREAGRVRATTVPAVDLAVLVHAGSPDAATETYSRLAAHVARHAVAVAGPVREYYAVGMRETPDPGEWRTEIGWPVFPTSR